MSPRGWFAARIERADYAGALFTGWRLRAWMDLNCWADFETGEVRRSGREMTMEWNASVGGVERWLKDMEEAGYVRMNRPGDAARSGRILVVCDIADRALQEWSNPRSKTGAKRGAKKSSSDADNHPPRGANGGAKVEQSVEHVLSNSNQELNLPTNPSGSAAEPPTSRPVLSLVPNDPDRLRTEELVAYWLRKQPPGTRPSESEKKKQGAAAKTICAEHTRSEISAACWGIERLFPFTPERNEKGGQPWDLIDLKRVFVKAVDKALSDHPQLKQQKEDAEFRAALELQQASGWL